MREIEDTLTGRSLHCLRKARPACRTAGFMGRQERRYGRIAAVMVAGTAFLFVARTARGEEAADIRQLKLSDWQPRSMLVSKVTDVAKPRFPAIDVHNHLGAGRDQLTPERVAAYVTEMNEAGVRTVVNLDGGWGQRLAETLAALDQAHPDRFLTFAQVDFGGIDADDWSQREASRLEESFRLGARGLKIHKSLGLGIRYKDGRLVAVDDPQLDPIWAMCGKHGRPVMIHTADPAAFFTPLDRCNERWHELNDHPQWLFYGNGYPAREDLLAQFLRVVGRHPQTTFIGAHFGNDAEDLAAVGRALDEHANLLVDIDARISELGRAPYSARRFFIKYQDRILFGTDTTPRRDAFRIYYRFLETDDEYFDCAASHHLQGFWRIYGLFLPDEVLEKVYAKNAERILLAQKPPAAAAADESPRPAPAPTWPVPRTADFTIRGDGSLPEWDKAAWLSLARRGSGADYTTRVKVLYSETGLYVLMDATDRKLSATMTEDFSDLWLEDVFEFFLWPDEKQSIYFEYEISPLAVELPILVPNVDGEFLGWRPWHYEGSRKIQKATTAVGGPKKSGATVNGWRAEIFMPFELLKPLAGVPPKPGSRWRANFYRMDYDDDRTSSWDWARVGANFHEFKKFGTLIFQ
jgi:predicted TIM-barrel fold metal-dependent hydrolase